MPATDPKAYGSSWYAATMVASPPRGRLAVEPDVDVCVIGGGLAGLTVAREVARRGWSVVVLEAHRIAWNASGRNAGFVLPGFAAPTPRRWSHASGSITRASCGRCPRRAPNMCATPSAKPACRASSSRRAAGCTCRRPATIRPSADRRSAGRQVRRRGRSLAGRAGARCAAHAALFQRAPLSARLCHPSAQLCARACGRRRGRGRAHLRGDAGARDRSGGRAQAHRHHAARGCAPRTWCSPATCTSAI